jgi:putative FmdB family regulatory protein
MYLEVVPTYEYQCGKCQRVFEVRQRISEPALTKCEACGGEVRRLLSATPFILKGGGWYVTDYPSEARKKGAESEKSAGKSSDSGNGKGDKAADKTGDKTSDKAADKPAAPAASTTSASAPATPAATKSESKSD